MLLALGLVCTAEAADSMLAKLKGVYEQTVFEYLAEYGEQQRDWQGKCQKVLEAERSRLQKSGDLDAWTIADRAVKQFEGTRDVTDKDIAAASGSTRKLLRRCRDMKRKYELKRDRRVVALHDKYIATLSQHQVELTQDGAIEEAFAVKAEIERAESSHTVVAARAALAPKKATAKASSSPPAKAASAPSASKGDERDTKPKKTEDGTVIYPPGANPPRDSSLVYKRSTLKRSPHMSLASKVNVSAWEGTRSKGNSSTSGSSFSKQRSDDRFLRLMIRTGQSGLELSDLYAVVEYFGYEFSSSSQRHVDPRRTSARIIKLDHLSQTSRYVDLSPARFATSHEGFHSSYSDYTYSQKSGRKYYGVIVSVFSNQGELLFQGATKPQLCERASAKSPNIKLMQAEEDENRLRSVYEAARDARNRDSDNRQLRDAYEVARDAYYAARSRTSSLRASRDR